MISLVALEGIPEVRPGDDLAEMIAAALAAAAIGLTDDDVLVPPRWLAEYVRAAREWPEAVYFGGTIRPHFETPPPSWITHNLQYLQGPLASPSPWDWPDLRGNGGGQRMSAQAAPERPTGAPKAEPMLRAEKVRREFG